MDLESDLRRDRRAPRSVPAIPVAAEQAAAKGTRSGNGNRAPICETRVCHWAQGWTRAWRGDLSGALSKLAQAIDEATASHDTMLQLYALLVQGFTRAALGDSNGARASADAALQAAADLMEFFEAPGHASCRSRLPSRRARRSGTAGIQPVAPTFGGLNRMMAGLYRVLSSGTAGVRRRRHRAAVGRRDRRAVSAAAICRWR